MLCWMALIFWFSLQSGAQSYAQSHKVLEIVERILNKFGIKFNQALFDIFAPFCKEKVTSEIFIRKLAHFTEYFIFGIICTASIIHWHKRKFLRFVPAALGVLTAAIDEMVIQQFLVSERTAAITDVLLDSIGFYVALIIIFVVSFAVLLIKHLRRRMLT